MPTYVFRCPKCGGVLEQLMSMGEYAQFPLPRCCREGCDGQQEMKPVITGGTGFILKGTGWTPKSDADFGVSSDIAGGRK
jgi:putative FmdB family regulatory protein